MANCDPTQEFEWCTSLNKQYDIPFTRGEYSIGVTHIYVKGNFSELESARIFHLTVDPRVVDKYLWIGGDHSINPVKTFIIDSTNTFSCSYSTEQVEFGVINLEATPKFKVSLLGEDGSSVSCTGMCVFKMKRLGGS